MLCWLGLQLCTGGLHGQDFVTGRVVESGSGEVLPYAAVLLAGSNQGTTTNSDGYFALANPGDDTIWLVVQYVGYENLSYLVLPGQSPENLVLELQPLSVQLQEVVVSSESYKFINPSAGISQTTISTKQLAQLPNVGEVDIFRSLQLLPGVSGTNENSSGLFVRGGTPDQNLVLLDGMTVYKVDHFFGFFSAFNANAIKDVQLYKGAYPAKYGGRISSVVDLTGKTGSFEALKGGAGINLLSANAYLQVPIARKLSLVVAGRRSYTDVLRTRFFQNLSGNLIQDDGLLDQLDESEISRVQPDFYYYDWNGKLSYRPGNNDLLTISLYNGQDYLDESRSFQRVITPDFDAVGNIVAEGEVLDKTDWGNKGISGRWSSQWGARMHTSLLVAASQYFSKYHRNGFLQVSIPSEDSVIFSGRGKTDEDNKVSDLTGRFDVEFQLPPTHKLEAGVLLTQSKVDYLRLRDDTISILDRNQKALYGSIYVSDTWTVFPKLKITGGLRTSYYELTDEFLLAPRFSAAYDLSEQWKIKMATGKFYQFVNQIVNENLSEGSRDFWLLADGDLVALSSAIHYVAGFSYERKGWLLDVEGYYKELSGLSEFSLRFGRTLGVEPSQLFFTGDGIARGMEFLLHKKLGKYTGWMSYTLGRVIHTFPGLNDGNEFPALHDQLHEFKMVHTYEIPEWTFSANFIFGSGKPYSEPDGQYSIELLNGRELNHVGVGPKNGSRLPPYHRLDLAAHYHFSMGKAKADIGVSVFNFYGRQNTWYYEYDFSQEPVLITELTYLGFTPNFSFNVEF